MGSVKNSWDSELNIKQGVDVIVPVKLVHVCDAISRLVRGDEFSIVTTMEEEKDLQIRLSEEYYIPKQRVSQSNIDYLPDDFSHNVVIHRHPEGCLNFSRTDHEYINQNFELSLLYTYERGFVNGLYNLKYKSGIIQIPVHITIDSGIHDVDISNIKREKLMSKFFEDDDEINDRRKKEKAERKKEEDFFKDKNENEDPIEELTTRLDIMEEFVFQGYQ